MGIMPSIEYSFMFQMELSYHVSFISKCNLMLAGEFNLDFRKQHLSCI